MADIKNTQIAASLKSSQAAVSKNMTLLATGKAVNGSGDGAAKLAKKTNLLSDIKNSGIAAENMQSASALLKSVEGFMGKIEESLVKAKELALSYENGDGKQIKAMIAQEFNNTVENINKISNSAKFGDKQIMMADYSHTIAITHVGKDIGANNIVFDERKGADNTPTELSYDSETKVFTVKLLNGNGTSQSLPYDQSAKKYTFTESGVNFVLKDGFNPNASFNHNNAGVSVEVKNADQSALVGTVSNLKLVKSKGGLDAILDAADYKAIEISGKVNDATISVGKNFSVSGVDFSEGAYSDRRITLHSATGEKMILQYDWKLEDVERKQAGSDATFGAATTLDSLDFTTDFQRKTDAGISISFQSGITGSSSDKIKINYPSIDTFNLKLDDVDLEADQTGVVAKLDNAASSMAEQRAKIGMTLKSIEETKSTLESTIDQYNNTLNAIDNVDTAAVTTDLAMAKAQVEMSISLIGQLNQQAAQYRDLVR